MKPIRTHLAAAALAVFAVLTLTAGVVQAKPPQPTTSVTTIMTGIQGASGSTVGPDGALYVTESNTGQVLRVDPSTGASSVFASGLPTKIAPIGGPMDLVFHGNTAYVLVSLVGPFFGSADPSGIYRVDGPSDFTVIADLGQWAIDNPPGPDIDYFIPTGVHFAIDTYRGGFVVTDGHHNKVLHVTLGGQVSELAVLGNVVPTGVEVIGGDVLIALTGPSPHLPEDGRIVRIDGRTGSTSPVASGGPLMIDVERGRGQTLFGLAQGVFGGGPEGSPAAPDTGELLAVGGTGDLHLVVGGLDRPSSMEVIDNVAFVVGLGGEIVRVDGIAGPPFGRG